MKNIVHLCDCMDFMKDLPDKHYELAIVDPPYGVGDFLRDTDSGSYKKGTKNSKRKYKREISWNNNIPDSKYFDQLTQISKKQIIWGANYYNCFTMGGALVWYKNPGLITQQSQCEIASLSWKQQVDYVYLQKTNGFIKNDEEYCHPCQKPVALYKWLLKNYAKPGQTIFDSHVGSGSLRIACYDMGFDFEGCEIDRDYWEAQEERFKKYIIHPDSYTKDKNSLFNLG